MREIKFRAWDKQHNCFTKFPFVVSNEGKVFERYDGGGHVKNHFVLMQYTGLKDKNGKEIYEGDICRSKAFMDVVEFCGGLFCFKRDMKSMPMEEHWPYEVIGNIYENPDLIKQS